MVEHSTYPYIFTFRADANRDSNGKMLANDLILYTVHSVLVIGASKFQNVIWNEEGRESCLCRLIRWFQAYCILPIVL